MAQKPKVYCGMKDSLPENKDYDRYGTRYECLKKGVGVGLYVIPREKREERLLSQKNVEKIARDLNILLYDGETKKTRKRLLGEIRHKLENMIDLEQEGNTTSRRKKKSGCQIL
jgi:hypothetical protein